MLCAYFLIFCVVAILIRDVFFMFFFFSCFLPVFEQKL